MSHTDIFSGKFIYVSMQMSSPIVRSLFLWEHNLTLGKIILLTLQLRHREPLLFGLSRADRVETQKSRTMPDKPNHQVWPFSHELLNNFGNRFLEEARLFEFLWSRKTHKNTVASQSDLGIKSRLTSIYAGNSFSLMYNWQQRGSTVPRTAGDAITLPFGGRARFSGRLKDLCAEHSS